MQMSLEQFNATGFQIVPRILSDSEIEQLISAVSMFQPTVTQSRRRRAFASRNLLHTGGAISNLPNIPKVCELATSLLGTDARVVRALFFDKTSEANWLVPWHQDVTIAVQQRTELPGFTTWTIKDGVQHVQPPAEILSEMLAMRIHLDDCGPQNGPLQVLPGSHSEGRLRDEGIERWRKQVSPVECHVSAGGALLMRPLIVHASAAAKLPHHRRVIHLEWCAASLPEPLKWY